MTRFWDPLCPHQSEPARKTWGKNFGIQVVEWLLEEEKKHLTELRSKQRNKENLQSISSNNFIRSLVNEKFLIKEEVGDPLVLKKGSREERRLKLIERYREDIQKRKAEMDECMIIEPEKQVAAKNCDVLEISDSDEDCVYLASNGKSVKNLIPSRTEPVSVRLQNDNRSVFPRSQQSSGTRVFLPENENFAIYEPNVPTFPQNGPNDNDLMKNRNFANSQISNKVESTVPKRKIENEPSIATKKSRIFEEPATEAPECPIHNQLIKLRRVDIKETLAIFNQDFIDNGPDRVVSLHCPIDNQKMKYPARGQNCMHAQTFDAKTAILKELKICPVCGKRIKATLVQI